MTFIIREVKKADREEITKLAKTYVESLKEPFYEPLWFSLLESYFLCLEIKDLEYKNLNIFCAEDTATKELVGMLVAEIETDRLRRRYGRTSLWYVKRSARGKKVGFELAQKAHEYLKKNKVIYVDTNIRDDTPKALAISQKLGFQKLYTRLRKYFF
ncbi:MAG: GNAT family N-acetyltransferase [Candidatus Helarchaeota archaeon]|nr:GNAT family N-acetyltransferase [Candidatus Helarchaeota archaeon]